MMAESTDRTRLEGLGAEAKTWVFSSPKRLEGVEAERLVGIVGSFLDGWESHGVRLPARCALLDGRFFVVAADERTDPSGCSIDKLFRLLQGLAVETGTTLLESDLVFYRDAAGDVQGVTRQMFRELAGNGEIDGDTIVVDTTVGTLGQILDGRWEKAARESWHARLLS